MFKLTKENIDFLKNVLIGFSLAFISQTKLRLGKIGIGEIIIFFFLLNYLFKQLFFNLKYKAVVFKKFSILKILIYSLLILFPLTLISFVMNKPGSELIDLFAIIFSFYFIYYLSISKLDLEIISKSFVYLFLTILTIRYIFFNSSSFEDLRFVAGALNPNQISLYVCCSLTLIVIYFKKSFSSFLIFIAYSYFGIITLSDAFYLYLFVLTFLFFLNQLYKFKFHIFILILFPFSIAFVNYINLFSEFFHLLNNIWSNADEGDERISLYINGINAWLDTPFSFFFGHGAGYFSGVDDKMKLMETHNTFIDALTIGGIFGIYFFYYYNIKSIVTFIKRRNLHLFITASSLIIFTMFHNIIRHPIYWFCVLVLYTISTENNNKKICAE